ncbi:asparaginase [Catellatospora sp. TT07R-123]|uniref:asparaginase n=1 Tax=Catellatospora sp. TT07R-123 TaxID=2733863 RepID=UPI001B26DC08|nr:asparaginase [Catellatospora sp. TT07R-123]GHJ46311.1 asparaginase [Catellatospora sp. TT07R-123]
MGKLYEGGVALVEVERSGFVEGGHRGSVIVLDASGTPVSTAGDVTGPIFARSSNKPMQAIGMLRAGLRLADQADLALVCASHYGEDFHIARVRALLRSGGLTEAALRCPPDLPLDDDAKVAVGGVKQRVYMNCSGKHSGMLLTCVAAGWNTEDYFQTDHPLQQRLSATVEELAGESAAATGVDGCGAPVLATSLTGLATAFQRIAEGVPGSLERTVADAMRAYPELVSGTNREDAQLMRAVPGLLCKVGAEGVWAAAIPGVGAVALKVDDGAARARGPVMMSALRRLGVTPDVPTLAEPALLGGGRRVGALHALW